MLRFMLSSFAAVAALCMAPAAPAADITAGYQPADKHLHQHTGFDNGHHAGWLHGRSVHGVMWVDKHEGHDAPAIHHIQQFAQGSMMFQRRASWLEPLKAGLPVRIQFDAEARLVNYLGSPTRRELVVELRDYDNPPADHPYTSVWTIVGYLDAVGLPGWRTLGVTIADPNSAALPEGWGGYGAEDSKGRPYLPPGRTFADVVAGADEIAITTFQPGYAYGSDHDFDVLYDNIDVSVLGQ